jgi:predicted nucleic acid-binding protein
MESTRPRVFVDTNVLFSALHSAEGASAQIVNLHTQGILQMIVSRRVLVELFRTVESKLPVRVAGLDRLLANAPPEVVRDPTQEEAVFASSEVNAGDAPIWEAALAADVDYFVTEDRRLLRECRVAQTAFAVLLPRELVERIRPPQ